MENLDISQAGTLESAPHRILVVDDEAFILNLTTEVLTNSGYSVDTAEDGAIAWNVLQFHRYDLLLTDYNMCRLNGVGLIKKLRAARMVLPVILMSGAVPEDELRRHPWLQIAATMQKPFTTAELLGTVRAALHATDLPRTYIEPSANMQSSQLKGRMLF